MFEALLLSVHRLAGSRAVRSTVTRLRAALWLLAAVLLAIHAKPEWFLIGFVISVTGALWQFWCLGALKKRKTLAMRGPYCLVRNPMYLGRYLLMLGALLFLGVPWIAVLFTAVFYFYVVNRVKREEVRLRGIFGQDYEDYCADVRRFLPTLRRFRWRTLWFFRWELFFESHGHLHALGLLVFYLAAAYSAYGGG